MKKLLLFIMCAAFGLSMQAQSLEFVNLNPNTTTINGPNDFVMAAYAQVKNNSAIGLTVKVRRTINSLATNHVNNFCFAGYCYPSTQDLSLPIDINPGQVTDSSHVTLRSDLNPTFTNGISTITYTAYNIDDPNDSVSITYTFHAGPDGVNELVNGSKFLSNAYPNPADKASLVSYNLPTLMDAHLLISNVLGSALNRIQLTEKTGSVNLPVDALPEGMYYYTLMNEGKPIISKRLMISHK
ncbi:MAG: T9SS type A sorting domain-containing protein [Bacteroidota bacterium]